MRFKKHYYNLGEQKANTTLTISIKSLEDLPEIIKIKSSCYCIKGKYDRKLKTLKVTYKPNEIPRQRRSHGFYETTKKLTIVYENGQVDTIRFMAKIIR